MAPAAHLLSHEVLPEDDAFVDITPDVSCKTIGGMDMQFMKTLLMFSAEERKELIRLKQLELQAVLANKMQASTAKTWRSTAPTPASSQSVQHMPGATSWARAFKAGDKALNVSTNLYFIIFILVCALLVVVCTQL